MWHRGAKVIVHNDQSARADGNAGGGKIHELSNGKMTGRTGEDPVAMRITSPRSWL